MSTMDRRRTVDKLIILKLPLVQATILSSYTWTLSNIAVPNYLDNGLYSSSLEGR